MDYELNPNCRDCPTVLLYQELIAQDRKELNHGNDRVFDMMVQNQLRVQLDDESPEDSLMRNIVKTTLVNKLLQEGLNWDESLLERERVEDFVQRANIDGAISEDFVLAPIDIIKDLIKIGDKLIADYRSSLLSDAPQYAYEIFAKHIIDSHSEYIEVSSEINHNNESVLHRSTANCKGPTKSMSLLQRLLGRESIKTCSLNAGYNSPWRQLAKQHIRILES